MERSQRPDYFSRLLLAVVALGVLGLLLVLSRRRVKFEVEVEIEPPSARENEEAEEDEGAAAEAGERGSESAMEGTASQSDGSRTEERP